MTTLQTKSKESKPVAVRKTALALLSERLNVPAEQLKNTLMSTAFATCRNEDEFLSAVIVANEYKLNPFTKEIYAFPAKNGGVIPIVSTDGWNKLMTTHPDYRSHEYIFSEDMEIPDGGKECPKWCEVTIHKQDGSRISVREYLDEVYRPAFISNGRAVPGPWQSHTKRMLRHKTKIQAAREAFGFGGIYDEDEGKRIVDAESRVMTEILEAPKSISGNDAKAENYQGKQTPESFATGITEDNRKSFKWPEILEKFRSALGESEFYATLSWHNVFQPKDIEGVDIDPIISEMKRSIEAKSK